MKNLILIIIALAMICSCGKKRTLTIIAKNAATGLPYSGLSYKIVSSRTAANGEKYRTEESGTLNANGEASLTIKQKTGRTYSVRVIEPANTCYNKQITQFFDSPFDVNGTFTFEFAECAYLRFRYFNSSCFNNLDHIEVTRISNIESYIGFKNPAVYDGCADYTMPNFIAVPMGTWCFSWSVNKNGLVNNYFDTINLAPNENRFYEFIY